jgi:cell division protein FtsW (lipid II flippase)
MGKSIKKGIRLKGDTSLWALVIVFSLLSLVFVYSSSSRQAVMENTTTFSIMLKQMRHILVGFLIIYIAHIIPLGFYRKMAYVAYVVGLGLLVYTLFGGDTLNESTRWLSIAGFRFQPSEFAKVFLILFVAKVLESNKLSTFKDFFLRLFLPVLVFIIPIMWEGFSTGFLLSFTILILLLVSKVKFRHIAATAGIVVLAAGLFYGTVVLYRVIKKDDNPSLTSTSRLATVEKRIGSFLTSDKDKELVENDQVVFSKVAIATGGIFGKIPGKGSLREVLPLSNSDYIFSIIVEETGLVGGTFVIGLYMWLLYSVIIIVRKCTKTFSAMLVCGLGILIVSQAMVHIMVNMKKMKNGSYDETFNYAISESTNPGSTFKLATLIALLEDGYVHLTDSVKTGKGGWRYYGKLFTEATSSLGTITVQQAFEKSSNVAFAMLAVEKYGTQEKRFINRLYNMKLNEKLNIELIGEGRATIPFPGEPGWSKLSLPMIAMGYEMQLTPLHILTFYNAIANNGRMVTPYFIESFLQHGKVTEHFEHTPLSGTLCTPGTLKAVHQALRGVVEHGTASRIHDSRYSISGKTGTAQIAYDGAYVHNGYRKHQASFVGFFPSDDPMYSMIVILYSNPTRSNFYGASWAAPVFKKIADHIYTTNPFWNAPLDEINLTHTNP